VPDDDGDGAGDGEPVAVHRRVDADQRQGQARQHPDGEQRLADVDRDDAERELPALGAQRVRPAGVATALLADVDALETADDETAQHGAEQVGDECLDGKFEHADSSP